MERTTKEWAVAHPGETVRALLLGVTPEIAAMNWPEKSSLLAVDRSYSMARSVWPGNIAGLRSVVCGNWLALPRRASSCDVVIGDGSINSLEYPNGFQALAEAVAGVLRKDGNLILRCYLQCERPENRQTVFEDARRGSIGSFHAFKMRLLMAMQESAESGVVVKDVHQAWMEENLDPRSLPTGEGWNSAAVKTIEFYRESNTAYSFPTLQQLRPALLAWFDEISVLWPRYELGERCPTLVLRPRKT